HGGRSRNAARHAQAFFQQSALARAVERCHGAGMSFHAELTELSGGVKRAHVLATVGELLGWGEQVNLPPGAAEQRAAQHATLAEVQHAAATARRIGELLTALEAKESEWDEEARAVVTQARRDYDRLTK